jgi:hypothetical protein
VRLRYETAPTSKDVDQAHIKKIGLASCPFHQTSFAVKDGRKAEMQNSAFGTVFGVADGKAMPVCDHGGFAPFGFGYRCCPGEQLTIHAIEDFLRKVWKEKNRVRETRHRQSRALAHRPDNGDRR